MPLYNGGLFGADPVTNPTGAALAGLRLTDAEIGPALRALLVDGGPDGVVGPVDFRSLSVREFGTLYEGLLESRLSVAPSALALDAAGHYVPTSQPDRAVVAPGDVYFHNRSGARKASGTYFTKPFAVEHLLDTALEPALNDHLARIGALLDEGRAAAAAEAFFDFRCADIAMGSGAFLVAACRYRGAALVEACHCEGDPRAAAATAAVGVNSALTNRSASEPGLGRR